MEETQIINSYIHGILIHKIFSYIFFIPFLWYLYALFSFKTYLALNKKMFFIMPITFFLIFTSLFTGIFLLAMRGFFIDLKVLLMIVVISIFLVGEIIRLKKIKFAKTSEQNMCLYVKFCRTMYISFIFILIILNGLIKMI